MERQSKKSIQALTRLYLIFDEISPGRNEGDILGEVDCRANTGAHGAGCFSTLIGSLSGKDD
jgi:hypothetical protein